VRTPRWIRTLVLTAGVLAVGCGPQSEEPSNPEAEAPSAEGVIVAMGDSLTEGYGEPEKDSYPAVLQELLNARGYRWRVVNAGISGETSSGARSRLDWVMKLTPDIVILETGANDALRGLPPATIFDNINAIVSELKRQNVVVVLAGMRIHPNFGPQYSRNFAELYERIARMHDIIRIPFFLEGVAGRPELNRPDGLHPNAAGYRQVAENALPYVEAAIEKHRQRARNS